MFFRNIGNYIWWFTHVRNKEDGEAMDLVIANTLFIKTLDKFRTQTKTVEFQINSRSPFKKDINLLKKHIETINFLRKVLKLRKRKIKKNIKELKRVSKLVSNENLT